MNLSSAIVRTVCAFAICFSLVSCSFFKPSIEPPTEDRIGDDKFAFQYLANIKNLDDLKELSQHLSRVESIHSASDLSRQLDQIALKETKSQEEIKRLRTVAENGQRQLSRMSTEQMIARNTLDELEKTAPTIEKRIDILKSNLDSIRKQMEHPIQPPNLQSEYYRVVDDELFAMKQKKDEADISISRLNVELKKLKVAFQEEDSTLRSVYKRIEEEQKLLEESSKERQALTKDPKSLKAVKIYIAVKDQFDRLTCRRKIPRIHNIGQDPIITFQRDESGKSGPVTIKIDGRDLDPNCATVTISPTGTVPVSPAGKESSGSSDYEVKLPTSKNPDYAEIGLTEQYVSKLKTGDQLTIQVVIEEAERIAVDPSHRLLTYATNTFTLYEVNDYRAKVLHDRILPHDIRAFPLPDADVEKLFGPIIRDHYYVVKISIRNPEKIAKVVNSGMIVASGHAKVEPLPISFYATPDKQEPKPQPSFTLPVSVVPQSASQVYSLLDDETENRPRAWIFRSLQFAGALATAGSIAAGSPIDLMKGVGLFTGVFLPEAGKLWPDRESGYKRNLVTFAMPDLIKIPPMGVYDNKLVFFAKRNLEAIIADPNMYGNLRDSERVLGTLEPTVRVISLAFHNLDIRYETVIELSPQEVRRQAGKARRAIDSLQADLRKISSEWVIDVPANRFSPRGITVAGWKEISQAIARGPNLDKVKDPEKEQLTANVKALNDSLAAIIRALRPTDKSTQDGGDYVADLLRNSEYGIDSLGQKAEEIDDVIKTMLSGRAEQTDEELIKISLRTMQEARERLTFYVRVAELLTTTKKDLLNVFSQQGESADTVRSAIQGITNMLSSILSAKQKSTAGTRQEIMMSVDWKKLEDAVGQVGMVKKVPDSSLAPVPPASEESPEPSREGENGAPREPNENR